jgi:hypothetical protein
MAWVRAQLCKLPKKGALDLQVIKFTSCLPMVGGSLRLPPPLKTGTGSHDIAVILLKVALKHKKSIKSNLFC